MKEKMYRVSKVNILQSRKKKKNAMNLDESSTAKTIW